MGKVQLPKDLYNAVESYIQEYSGEALIRSKVQCDNDYATFSNRFKPLTSVDLMTLVNAITKGYELEDTPEEKILHYYNQAVSDAESNDYDREFTGEAAKDAVEFVLEQLKVKIDGIN